MCVCLSIFFFYFPIATLNFNRYIAFDVELGNTLGSFDNFVTSCFFLDIFLNFRTAFIDYAGNPVYDSRQIARHYWQMGLWLDVLGTFPFDVFAPFFSFGTRQFVTNCLKAPNLLRVSRLALNDRITQFVSPFSRIIKLLLGFVFVAHLFASLFFFVAKVQKGDYSWVTVNQLQDSSVYEQYTASMYWALSTMVTVGYGDITAVTVYEQAVVIPILLLSALIYAAIFGNMAYAIETLTSTLRRYQSEMDKVKEFIKVYELPLELQDKLYNYTNAMWSVSLSNLSISAFC